MCSLQSANVGVYPSEQLEDDFITNLFSQNISSNNNCVQIEPVSAVHSNQNVVQDSIWFSANQMDHDYAQTEPSTSLQNWEDQTTDKSSASLNMSTYFSTFDPSVQMHNNQLQSSNIQNKLIRIQHSMGHIHRAQINMVPTATGHFKANVKRKRKRTVFRTDQVEAMEKVFAKKPYVTKEDRKILVDTLHINDKSVKVWFQNRRLKNKRGEDQYNSEDEENSSSPNLDRLDYVESKIHERTNEFGYVTLDDKILDDLYNVIDEYLNKPRCNVSANDIEMKETKVKDEFMPLYEPISPASNIDNSNEENSWAFQTPVGNEYLQRLIDIESIISN